MADHSYDAVGVCTFCDRCDDGTCCEQVECDQRVWKIVKELQAVLETSPHKLPGTLDSLR